MEMISEQFGRELSWLSRETRFADLAVDSLDLVEFVMVCEEEFNRTIPEDLAKEIETIGQLIDWLSDDSGGAGVTAGLPKPPKPRRQNRAPPPESLE